MDIPTASNADVESKADNSPVTVDKTVMKGHRAMVAARGHNSPVKVSDSYLEATRPYRSAVIESVGDGSPVTVTKTTLDGPPFSGGASVITVGVNSPLKVEESLMIGDTGRVIAVTDTAEAKKNDFTGVVSGGITIKGLAGCISSDNTPDVACTP